MPEQTDEKGVLADCIRVAGGEDFKTVLMEVIGNRYHNPDKSTAEYLFARLRMPIVNDGPNVRFFILGYSHHRTRESIIREHTPFSFSHKQNSETARLGSRGYGAKLFPAYVGGHYSLWFQLENSETFPVDRDSWGYKDNINITELAECIRDNQDFDPRDYREKYFIPSSRNLSVVPFFSNTAFRDTPLFSFMQEHNLRSFYVFMDYSSKVDDCYETTLDSLAKLYEGKQVNIYRSDGFEQPNIVKPSVSFGLLPTHWTGSICLEWVMGDKDTVTNKYYKSKFRFFDPKTNKEVFGKLESNGSKDRKFNIRFSSIKMDEVDIQNWSPDFSVTIAMVTPEYREKCDESEKNLSSKLSRYVYTFMEGDLIDDEPSELGLNSTIRHMSDSNRLRILVHILKERVKDSELSGLRVGHVKRHTTIEKSYVIHESIVQTLKLADRAFKEMRAQDSTLCNPNVFYSSETLEYIAKEIAGDKQRYTRAKQRKKEALKFEDQVAEKIKLNLGSIDLNGLDIPIQWEDNDARISANHELGDCQGIDMLGRIQLPDTSLWIALQLKDKEATLSTPDKTKFLNTIEKLKEQYSNDKVYSFLVLAKQTSFSMALHMSLLKEGVFTIVDTHEGDDTLAVLETMITKIMV